MNKGSLVSCVTEMLKERGIKKEISIPKQVFQISDGNGNVKKFSVKQTDRYVYMNKSDVEAVVDTVLLAIEDAMKRGEDVSIHGFGTFGMRYMKERKLNFRGVDTQDMSEGHYVPKFYFGKNLRLCTQLYDRSVKDRSISDSIPDIEEGGS